MKYKVGTDGLEAERQTQSQKGLKDIISCCFLIGFADNKINRE